MRRLVMLVVAVVVLTLALSGVALAASPQDVYDDYAQNGKLTGKYTQAELQAYLNDAAVHQYGAPGVVAELDAIVKDLIADMREEEGREDFPFTGAPVLAGMMAAATLIGAGVGLRRLRAR